MTITNNFTDDASLELVPRSVITNLGTVLVGNTRGDTNITLFIQYFVVNPDFPIVNITFRARLTNMAASDGNATLTSHLVYLSSPTPYARYSYLSANSTIGTTGPTVSAVVHSSSLNTTSGNQAAIGEIMLVNVKIKMSEGIITSPRLSFTLPVGLYLINASVVSLGNASSCATAPQPTFNDSNTDGSIDTALFAFSQLCNVGDNIDDDNDFVVVAIAVQVQDIASTQRGSSLTCTATFAYGQRSAKATGQVAIVVVEPLLRVTVLASQPTLGGDYGTSLQYTITLAHTQFSNSIAYNVQISTLIPSELDVDASSITASSGTPTVDGRKITVHFDQYRFGQTYSLSYNASLGQGQLASDSIVNSASAYWSSLPTYPGARNSSASSSVYVTIGVATLTAFNLTTSLPETTKDHATDPATEVVAIGEVITTYAQTLVPNGERPFLFISLELPLEPLQVKASQPTVLVGVSITVNGPTFSGTTANSIWFNFTDIENPLDGFVDAGDMISLSIVSVIADVPENQNHVVLSNNATLRSADASFFESLPIRIAVPDLTIATSVSIPHPEYTQAGDVLTYTVVVSHTANSSAPAYVVNITDALSPYHTVVIGSVITSNGTVIQGNTNGDTSVLVLVPVFDLGDGILNHSFFFFFSFSHSLV